LRNHLLMSLCIEIWLLWKKSNNQHCRHKEWLVSDRWSSFNFLCGFLLILIFVCLSFILWLSSLCCTFYILYVICARVVF
jgi:hypothetical protein